MARIQRLLVVAAGLAATAFFSVPTTSGQAAKKGAVVIPPSPPAAEEALADSKFAEAALVTYKPLEGDTLFALQVKPELKAPPRRPRDYVIMVSSSATQSGEGWIASQQIAEEIIAGAEEGDRVALWVFSTPDDKATFSLTRGLLSAKDEAKKLADAVQALKKKSYPA